MVVIFVLSEIFRFAVGLGFRILCVLLFCVLRLFGADFDDCWFVVEIGFACCLCTWFLGFLICSVGLSLGLYVFELLSTFCLLVVCILGLLSAWVSSFSVIF